MLLGRAGCLCVVFLLYGPEKNHPQPTDLKVKVSAATVGEKSLVTLTCSSGSHFENPLNIWYKSGEIIYQDSDPWYQYPVTSEDAGSNYSCAVKGHEASRSPAVSVELATENCVKVTYKNKGFCESGKSSSDKTCSFTYPRDLQVKVSSSSQQRTWLTCSTSCYPTGTPTPTYTWYKNKDQETQTSSQFSLISSSTDSYSCSVAGREERSPSVCVKGKNCWSVNYITKRICAVRGSSVNMSCSYTYPSNQQLRKTFWYTKAKDGQSEPERLSGPRFELHEERDSHPTLRITGLKKTDTDQYKFRILTNGEPGKYSGIPGVNLHVTGLQVKVTPSTVTEGQNVTLTCSTTCYLPGDLTYIWYKNRQVLTQVEAQQKNLYLNQVSSEDYGSSYSCAIKGHDDITSSNKTLTVRYAPKNLSVLVSPSGEIVEGSSVTLTCSSDANPPVVNYSWYKENTASIISSGPNYTISNFTSEDAGYYICEARHEAGHINSTTQLVFLRGNLFFSYYLAFRLAAFLVMTIIPVSINLWFRTRRAPKSTDPEQHEQLAGPGLDNGSVFGMVLIPTTSAQGHQQRRGSLI